ncbi:MAG: STAS domain-containing protein [Thermoleophilia bacterium]|nr:STAS domain-containing protein [Thermoleophilia bacterium]
MALELATNRETEVANEGYAEALRQAVEFRVDVTRERGAVRLCPVGELDMATIGCLREHLDEARDAGHVTLDLRQATFLDSSALHLAVEAHERAARDGTGFAIVPAPPMVQRAFDIAGLSARLPFVDVPRP